MPVTKVIVLTSQSLLTQGIISNLRKSPYPLDVVGLDIHELNLFQTLSELQPDIIILEWSSELSGHGCSLQQIFEQFPRLIVLEVNLKTSRVQMIRSDLYDASGFDSLLKVIENVQTNLSNAFSPLAS